MVKVKDTVTITGDIDGYVSGVVTADLGNNKYEVRRENGSVKIYNGQDLSLYGGKRRTNKRKSRKSRKSRRSRR